MIRVGLLNVAWNSRQRGGYEVRKISDQSDRDLILGAVRQRYGFAIGESLLVSKGKGKPICSLLGRGTEVNGQNGTEDR